MTSTAAQAPPPVSGSVDGDRVRSATRSRRSRLTASTLRALARWAPFVEDEVRGLSRLIGRGDICLDIGAQYGLYSQVMSALVGPRGTVMASEPQPAAAAALRVGARLAGADNIRVTGLALADRPGARVLRIPVRAGRAVHGRAHLDSDGAGSPSDPNREFRTSRTTLVPTTTVDDLVRAEGLPRIDYIKADVEGAEHLVLRGALATIDAHLPTVQLEIEERFTPRFDTSPSAVADVLLERGYTMHVWRQDRWAAAAAVTSDRRNYVFVHPRRQRRVG